MVETTENKNGELVVLRFRPELSAKSTTSQIMSYVFVNAFDESLLFIASRNTRRNHSLPPLHQVLIALRFYISGSFLQVIGDTFASVDKSTVSRVITDMSRALIAKQPRVI